MTTKQYLDAVSRILGLAQDLAPIAAALGVPLAGQAAVLIGAGVELAQAVGAAIEDGHLIATTDDRAELSALIGRLSEENDKLAAEIAAS